MKYIYIILFFYVNCFSQKATNIQGKVLDIKHFNDTLIFTSGLNNVIYYDKTNIKVNVDFGDFEIENNFAYPQPYLIAWESERNNIPFRFGFYFLDNNTTSIKIDSVYKNSVLNSPSQKEYKNKFLPYFNENELIVDSEKLFVNNSDEFDNLLKKYVCDNKNSYVALWFLINQFNTYGFKNIYIDISDNFSNRIKSSKLFKIFIDDISKVKIRQFEKFPKIELKNTNIETVKLILPQKKYVLIDFWFSRCKPCLEQIPVLKDIYNKNRDIFEIIAVSTDRSENIEVWKKRINEKEINWINYLDENGTFALSQKINSFPTNFLLDEKGYIIKKNISLEELKELLNN
jgi:thiol-disulfide isomerase/thioredoxin